MNGPGTLTLAKGTKISGNWVADELEGYAQVLEVGSSSEQQYKFHRNVVFHSSDPQAIGGGSDN